MIGRRELRLKTNKKNWQQKFHILDLTLMF